MTDISRILPDFPLSQYASLIPTLEKHQVVCRNLTGASQAHNR